jgi:hypothetical protein
VQRLLKRYGFASLVLLALACASFLAGSAKVPEQVPDYALQAEEIYRLEIGAASFVAFYLATMAVVLALGGRGFAEFGTKGLKAEDVVDHAARNNQQEVLSRQALVDLETQRELNRLHAQMLDLQVDLRSHAQRLKELESSSLS